MTTYLVDTENVGTDWLDMLSNIHKTDTVVLFYTAANLHANLQLQQIEIINRSGASLEAIYCTTGENALDFQLVTELGYRVAHRPAGRFVIVSRDKGFDHAVSYWQRRQVIIRRAVPELEQSRIKRSKQDPVPTADTADTMRKAKNSECKETYAKKLRAKGVTQSDQTYAIANILMDAMRLPGKGRSLQVKNRLKKRFGAKLADSLWHRVKPVVDDVSRNGPYPQ